VLHRFADAFAVNVDMPETRFLRLSKNVALLLYCVPFVPHTVRSAVVGQTDAGRFGFASVRSPPQFTTSSVATSLFLPSFSSTASDREAGPCGRARIRLTVSQVCDEINLLNPEGP